MTIAHHAQAKSENFSYEGYGASPETARSALLEGLRAHAAELDLEPTWCDEMVAKCIVSPVASGTSRIETFDLSVAGQQVARVDMDGDVAWRSYCEMKLPGLDWGYVDGHGPTEYLARVAMMAGVDAMLGMGAHTSLTRDQILSEAETYRVRDGGAYRGGMIRGAGEPLLDGHLPPPLPTHSTDWLPTVQCTFEVIGSDGVISRSEATARPNRQNQMPMTTFFENDLMQSIDRLKDGIASPDLRSLVEFQINMRLSDLVVTALLSRLGKSLCHDVELRGGVRLVISFEPRATTAESLVAPRD